MAKRQKPPAPDPSTDTYLSAEDLLRVNLLHAQRDLALAQVQIQLREDALSRSAARIAQLESMVVELRTAIQCKAKEESMALHKDAADKKQQEIDALKAELGERYGVGNWEKVTYDEETGRLNNLP